MIDPHGPLTVGDGEPRSPSWLPYLGAALFVALALLWRLTPPMPLPPPSSPAAASGGPPAPALAARPAAAPPGDANRGVVPSAGNAR